ncbi:unnamed protein product [Ceutorhynchus assimilis]|uniref:Uncharacterized protein n=1 Tax=Ceutorhynchus assimilis TaxID=467358 RepID=A0A9N9MW21_9CUCU|nr:unnamed protein product [Ceutorhynchus assimilis]
MLFFTKRECSEAQPKSYTGEAKMAVEMLLITAQNPDDIIDILQQKYGRPEVIMGEILITVNNLHEAEPFESFINFSSVVRNIEIVISGEVAFYDVDQRHVLGK